MKWHDVIVQKNVFRDLCESLDGTEPYYSSQCKESHRCCCHGPLAPLTMGDCGTSTVLTRKYESMQLRSLLQTERTSVRWTRYNTRDELIRTIGQSIRNINKDVRADGIRRLPNIWQKVINNGATILKVHKCCIPVNKAMSEISNCCHYFLSNHGRLAR